MKEQVKNYEMNDADGIGVYCGTYHKYNCGSLYGMWIDLTQFTDAEEFFDVCNQLHDDEDDPELMFQDFQGFPEDFYGESMGVDEVQKILDYILLDDNEKEMIEDYIEVKGGKIKDFEDILSDAKDNFGRYGSFSDFSDQIAEEQIGCNCGSCADWVRNYFDYNKYAEALEQDYSIGSNGYVFSNY